MNTGRWFRLLVLSCILAGCLGGGAGAASLTMEWKEPASEDNPFLGVMITPDASLIFTGGNEMYVRSWDRKIHWIKIPGRATAISSLGDRVVMAVGDKVTVLDRDGAENWSRSMDGYVKAVAVSPNGSTIISADNKGNYLSWNGVGELIARDKNATVTSMLYAPGGDFFVVATQNGLRFYDRRLELIWYDNRTESRDEFIAISGDGSTVITAGYNQVASYTREGTLNWRQEVTREPIIDMHCSVDCSAIIVGGQDKEIVAIDRYGTVRWRYRTGQWVSSVGISRDGSVIAAGGIDQTIYLLDRGGALTATKKTDAIIQPRSLAVSSDGRRIVVADQKNLYGFSMVGDAVAPDVPETYTLAPLNPVQTTHPTPFSEPVRVTTAMTTLAPATSAPPTTYTPADPVFILPALGAAVVLYRRLR